MRLIDRLAAPWNPILLEFDHRNGLWALSNWIAEFTNCRFDFSSEIHRGHPPYLLSSSLRFDGWQLAKGPYFVQNCYSSDLAPM